MIAGTLEIQMMANFARLIEDVRQVQQKVDAGMTAIERSVGLASRALGGLAAGFSVTKLVGYADAWGQLSSRMNQATGSATAGEAAMSRLMDVSNRVYKPIADTAELFIRTSESLKQMGYTTAETVDMVETLSYGLTVSSASADKTKSVIDAWSKSMLQGKMTMGEYQTVISGAPALQKALADALGVTIAGLQDMVGKGQLSADKLMLVTKQMQELGKQADAMPVTVTDAFTKLVNNVTQYAGELNKSTGATSLLTGAIDILAKNVGPVLTMLATMVGLAVSSWLTTVVSGAVAAGGAFTAAGVAVKGFMASLGPLGWLVLAVGAGTAAYQAFKNKAEEAGRASQEAAAAAERAGPRMLAGLTPALDALNKKLDDYIAKKKQAMGVGPTDIEALGKEYSDANKKIEEAGRALHALSGRMDAEAQSKRTAILKELADETGKLAETDKKIAEARKLTVTEYLADTGRMTEAQRKAADIAKETANYERAIALAQGDAGQVAQITAAHQTALGEIRSKYSKQVVAGTKQEEKSYLSLLDAINAKIAEEKLEHQSSEAITESQRLRIKMQAELKKNISSDHKAILESKLKELEVEEKLTATYKEAAEARKAWQDQQKQNVDAAFATANSLEEGNKQLRDEIALIGKSKKEQETILRLRREQVIVAKEKELADLQAKKSFEVYDTMMIQALQEQIKQLRERNELLGQKEVAEETATLVQSQEGNWVSFFQSIDQSAHQTWTNVFEDGAGTFKRLGQTLKSAVLDMLYQLTIRKWIINIGASLFGDGSSAMMGALGTVLGGSGGGGIGNLLNLGSAANSGYGLYSGSTAGLIGRGLTNFGTYTGSHWATGLGMQIQGQALPASMVGPGSGVGIGNGGTGSAMGLNGGWGAAGVMMIPLIAAYLGGMFKEEKQVGTGITGELGGNLYGYQLLRESGSLFSGPDYRYIVAEKEQEKARAEIERLKKEIADNPDDPRNGYRQRQMQQQYSRLEMLDQYNGSIEAVAGPIKILQDAFKDMREDTAARADSLGLNGDSIRAMKVALGLDEIHPDTGGRGLELTGLTQEEAAAKIEAALAQANEEMARSVLGKWEEQTREITRMVWDTVDVVSDGDTQQQARVGREVTETVTEQVFVMGEYVRVGETAVDALTRLSASLAGVNMVFDLLGTTLLEGSLSAADWASKLVDAMGSMDALTQAAATYYDLYYSEEEKRTRAAQQADKGMKEMGLDLRVGDIDAKAKYRALVEKAIADKDEVMLAKLLQFADDFAAGADAASASLQQARDELTARMQELIEIREETLSTLGLSVDGLVDGFINEINEGRGAQAGEWLADSIASGFEQAIYRQAVTTILNSIIDGVITPVVTAAMAGSSVSGLVSGAAIETMVANAKAAAVALKTLLNDPAFKAMLDETIDFVRDLGNDIGSVIPPMSTYSPAIKDVAKGYDSATKAAEDAAAAAKKLADQWRKTIDSMLNEMERLRSELLGVTDDHGAAYYEALFAIKTAQARAGDQDAADELPQIIRNLENMAKANASSQADVLLKQAEWLASLTDTRSYLAGKYGVDIGNQQVAEAAAAAAGRVIQTTGSAAFSGALQSSSDNPVLVSEVRALRVALENHDNNRKSEAAASVPAVQRMNKVLTRWDTEGMPQPREEEESA
ncbi:tape measure protein [Comamonas sediminis]|uniref:Tape measure protein n=1 Tax=Comamonas sediminis TaxID=1783360 RepID=A0ABV4B3P6_9BURK